MTQRGMPQKLHGLAREIVHIHEQVGMNRWRLAAGRIRDGFEPVPRVELPDWSTADANSLVNTFAVTRAPKVNVRHRVEHTTHHARTYELTERGVRAVVKRTAEAAAEQTGDEDFEHVSSHDLRRRFAQRLLVDENMNPRVVMQVGGWSSFQAIEPYLNAPTEEVVDDAFAEVEAR